MPALLGELGDGDELIVVDNDSADGSLDAVPALAPKARLVQTAATPVLPAPATPGPRRREGICSSSSIRTRHRCRDSARRSAGRGCRREGGPPGRRSSPTWGDQDQLRRQPHSLHRDRLGGRSRPADRRRRRRPARSPRSPGPAWRYRAGPGRSWAASPSSSSSTTRMSTSRCGCGCAVERWGSSRQRSSTTTTSSAAVVKVALAGAQSMGLPHPHLSRRALLALLAPALIATELALIPVAIAGGWGRQKLDGDVGSRALAAAPAARAARGAGDSHGQRRPLRLMANSRPRLPVHRRSGPLNSSPRRPSQLLESDLRPLKWLSR